MHVQEPRGSILSLREFLVHISIVTLGILIALGLEQLRETVHDRNLVRETRALLDGDMRTDRQNLVKELQNVEEMSRQLAGLHDALAAAGADSQQLQEHIGAIQPAEYFFSTSAWQTALSTGALVHMPVDEVAKLNDVYFLVDQYTRLVHGVDPLFVDFRVFGKSLGKPSAGDLTSLNEKRCRFAIQVAHMAHVGAQLGIALDLALGLPPRSLGPYRSPVGC